jgi:hypothetical protein
MISLSLKEAYAGGDAARRAARSVLEAYYPLLRSVFPVVGEIETVAAYDQYLQDADLEWDIVVLRDDPDGDILGGIQWQALREAGPPWAKSLAWVEHIWLSNQAGVRTYLAFRGLLGTVRDRLSEKGVRVGFMEFNDPDKMSFAEQEEDARGGVSTRDRLLLWGRAGVCEVGFTTGGVWKGAPYAQPSMEGGPPVTILTLGFFSFGPKLIEQQLPVADYLRILHRAHATIRGVDPAVDPTCRQYTEEVNALGIPAFSFLPLRRRLGNHAAHP